MLQLPAPQPDDHAFPVRTGRRIVTLAATRRAMQALPTRKPVPVEIKTPTA